VGSLEAVRLRDRTTLSDGAPPSIDLSAFGGRWVNTEARWRWLASIDVRTEEGRLRVHPRGGNAPSPGDWGEREADLVCATSIDSREGGGYIATFPLGTMDTELQVTLNQGLLVVVAFNRTRDAATAPGRVTREFFRRVGESA
jgi:hypothetical protein